ncbi:hypothetical protein CRYPD_730 [uncultured Candidatus Thioglobus sp.]|nr:hypothetical protein CRYPD_730 [uncultured Candidatus Thioglobus sp.]
MKILIKNTCTAYNNAANLITHIVEGHFSVLNKLKRFLTFSALTLTLNVASAGDVNQFNKQSYLGLSAEYNWNQPQSHYRKDNQATTVTVTDVSDTGPFVSETITFKGLTYKTILSPDTGKVWLDRNLGSTQVATSSSDAASYGDLYQWGRNNDGHEDRTKASTSTTLASSITDAGTPLFIIDSDNPNDWTSIDSSGASRTSAWANNGANDICPAGFSVPTSAEMTSDTIFATTTKITNSATALSSFLKLPVAGYRHSENGKIEYVGIYGLYWSRNTDSDVFSSLLAFGSGYAKLYDDGRATGMSIRCIKG